MGFLETLASQPLITAAGVAIAGAAGIYLYASRVEAHSYRLEELPVLHLAGAGRDGTRRVKILHLSDLHLCEPESAKVKFLETVNASQFDLVVITGDVFENPSGIKYASRLINGRPRAGAFAVLGNHDYYAYTWMNKTYGRLHRKYRHPVSKRDVQPFIDALDAIGVTTLRNECVYLEEQNIFVIGIDYPCTTAERWSELRAQAPPGSLILALQHVPYKLNLMTEAGVQLAFAGHTHGGQIRIPGLGALITDSELPRQEASGIVTRGQTVIHVSRGLSADPKTNFRLFCPPAATALEVVY